MTPLCIRAGLEEFAHMYTWASGPVPEVKYKIASPCDPVDLLQTLLELMLLQRAASTGFATRFSTECVAFRDADEPGVTHNRDLSDIINLCRPWSFALLVALNAVESARIEYQSLLFRATSLLLGPGANRDNYLEQMMSYPRGILTDPIYAVFHNRRGRDPLMFTIQLEQGSSQMLSGFRRICL